MNVSGTAVDGLVNQARAPPEGTFRQGRNVFVTIHGSDAQLTTVVDSLKHGLDEGAFTKAFVSREVGSETNRTHLQGCLGTGKNRRTMKWYIDFFTGVGLELGDQDGDHKFGLWVRNQLGTDTQARDYCFKEGSVVEIDHPDSETRKPGARTDFAALRNGFVDGTYRNVRDVMDDDQAVGIVARYAPFVERVEQEYGIPYDVTQGEPLPTELYRYQEEMVQIALKDPRDLDQRRAINVILGTKGGEGKSFIADNLERVLLECYGVKKRVQILHPGKLADMATAVDKYADIFIIDIARSRIDSFNWCVAEDLKNRRIFESKYKSTMKHLKFNHVFVMCNEFENETVTSDGRTSMKFSEDRLNLCQITDYDMTKIAINGAEYRGNNMGDGPFIKGPVLRIMPRHDQKETTEWFQGVPCIHRNGTVSGDRRELMCSGECVFSMAVGWPGRLEFDGNLEFPTRVFCMKDGHWKTIYTDGSTDTGVEIYHLLPPELVKGEMQNRGWLKYSPKGWFATPESFKPKRWPDTTYHVEVTHVPSIDWTYTYGFNGRPGRVPCDARVDDHQDILDRVECPKDHKDGYEGYLIGLMDKYQERMYPDGDKKE